MNRFTVIFVICLMVAGIFAVPVAQVQTVHDLPIAGSNLRSDDRVYLVRKPRQIFGGFPGGFYPGGFSDSFGFDYYQGGGGFGGFPYYGGGGFYDQFSFGGGYGSPFGFF